MLCVSFSKAIAAIRSLDYVITDGKALTRAKTKVPGVGAKIAELVDKFLTTGLFLFRVKQLTCYV